MANIFNLMAKRSARKGTGKVKLGITVERHESIGKLSVSAKDVVPDSFSTRDIVEAIKGAPEVSLSTSGTTDEGDKAKLAQTVGSLNVEDRERYLTGLFGSAAQFSDMEAYFRRVIAEEEAARQSSAPAPAAQPEPLTAPAPKTKGKGKGKGKPADRAEIVQDALQSVGANGDGAAPTHNGDAS